MRCTFQIRHTVIDRSFFPGGYFKVALFIFNVGYTVSPFYIETKYVLEVQYMTTF